ncbi:hypothetical protein QIH38_11590 [Klebsiella pneumoniae]|nr:hypothetical protein [Klebsiella pneumoniae]MDH8492873.1 hypothetical protein [Klebsiella pneumoniae]MDH8552402.1 hypothetical protein [Klebsiella pneumoniae]MDH8599285.1 hypothetical protein [Klebsiella pneumoniae]
MTSKLTRERLAEIAQFGFSSAITPANDFEIKELARLALAAMDSKPVFFIEVEGDDWINAGRIEGKNRQDLGLLPDGINYLYAAPQPPTDAEREELQELRRSYLALRGENEDLQAQLYEAESQADDAAEEIQERRKADSESVAEVLSNRPGNGTSIVDVALPVGTQLYRHAQPAPEYPEVLPCPVLLEPGLRFGKGIKTSTMLAALARRAVYESDMAALSPEERAEFQARIEDFKSLIAQQPVVPDERDKAVDADDHPLLWSFNAGWNACRAAMLQAGTLIGEGTKQAGNSPAIPDGYVMVPKEPTKEMINARWLYYMGTKNPSSKGTYKAMLAAAPQEVGDA